MNVLARQPKGEARTNPLLEFEDVTKDFTVPGKSHLRVLTGISFAVKPGQFTAVVGPSGCGKSTLLHMAAGLLPPTTGKVRQAGHVIDSINRNVGFVPQQATLYPWKTLHDNVALPLLLRGVSAEERTRRVHDMLTAVGLAGFEEHFAHQLSGGMQKRAAIARTMIYEPDVVLMDEPFGALDAQTRMIMQRDLQELWMRRATTILFVTHDLTEAILLADNIILLSRLPTRIKTDIAIDLGRPRNIFEPYLNQGFAETYRRVWEAFQSELSESHAQGAR
jgi:NitT/TauT family transport system ATP-binding protein